MAIASKRKRLGLEDAEVQIKLKEINNKIKEFGQIDFPLLKDFKFKLGGQEAGELETQRSDLSSEEEIVEKKSVVRSTKSIIGAISNAKRSEVDQSETKNVQDHPYDKLFSKKVT